MYAVKNEHQTDDYRYQAHHNLWLYQKPYTYCQNHKPQHRWKTIRDYIQKIAAHIDHSDDDKHYRKHIGHNREHRSSPYDKHQSQRYAKHWWQ